MEQHNPNPQNDDPTSSSDPAEPGKPKVVFAPGCFDDFTGTQEELDELIAEIQRLVETGEIFEKATRMSEEESERILERPHGQTRQ